MPDDTNILYSTNNELRIFNIQKGTTTTFAKTPGKAYWLRWSPSGDRLRFTVLDPLTHAYSLWELTLKDPTPKQLLIHWREPSDNCCGVWGADGSFIFQSIHNNESDLWLLPRNSRSTAKQLTNGPFWFESPTASPVENRLFFIGVSERTNVQVFNAVTRGFRPAPPFLHDAQEIDNSRNNQWVAWVDGAGKLWRARTDGSDKLQLTPDMMTVYMGRWSPDGTRIALIARTAGQPWQLYIVQSDGGHLEQLLKEPQNDTDPTWSPDGRSIMFGRMPLYLGGEESPWGLRTLNLETHQVKTLPGSGMFSPHWSPDGRYILALTKDQKGLLLFDMQTHEWTKLHAGGESEDRFFSNPSWSADGRAVYVQDTRDIQEPILRISVPDGHVEEICTLQNFLSNNAVDYTFVGLTAQDIPLVRTRVNGDIYSLTFPVH
ncbi:MAG: hypothetical protein PW789_07230 [Edaphobacter sp.]|uniref:TolB family protein n=1 Tax=Edaphobacter sp. TaxID=1934404 RepID=UPI002398D18A|nr:hypothetical protein [Edaphobacter sp.]MDE1176388.1 hypothetical protein [Edaphobacter sp.]